MTESEWLTTDDPLAMLGFLRGKTSDRKLRMFTCGCCRHVWDHLQTPWIRDMVDLLERIADGLAETYQLDHLGPWDVPLENLSRPLTNREPLAASLRLRNSWEMARQVSWETCGLAGRRKERRFQTSLLRCLLGNPFRPVPVLDPAWLSWNDQAVLILARTLYEERAFGHLPILADALQDAGCDDVDVLDHLRSHEPHGPGCWVLDLVLAKG